MPTTSNLLMTSCGFFRTSLASYLPSKCICHLESKLYIIFLAPEIVIKNVAARCPITAEYLLVFVSELLYLS